LAELLGALRLDRAEIVRPMPRPDPWLALDRGVRADLVLGGPWWAYALRRGDTPKGATRGDGERASSWVALPPATVGVWVEETVSRLPARGASFWSLAADESLARRLGWADPRTDGPLLTAAAGHLALDWSAGYADLVRWSAQARCEPDLSPSGTWPGLVAAFWGDSESASEARGFRFHGCAEYEPFVQGAAVLPGAREAESLHAALQGLGSPGRPVRAETGTDSSFLQSPMGMSLLADLLHATLVAAQPELRQAWAVLRVAKSRGTDTASRAEHWIVQPAPWPPASVELLKTKPRARTLLWELAVQLTSTAARRDWLLAQFDRDAGCLDGSVLLPLAECDDGRLGFEPRFRTWLRAEWQAWARQRYRRAARLAEGKAGPA
jgi:hypothetical protein